MKDAFGWIQKIKDLAAKNALSIISENLRKLDSQRLSLIEEILGGGSSGADPAVYYQTIYKDGNPVPQRGILDLGGMLINDEAGLNRTLATAYYNNISSGAFSATQAPELRFDPSDLIEVYDGFGFTGVYVRIKETGGPQELGIGAIADGEFLKRVGTDIVGSAGGGGGEVNTASNVGAGVGIWKDKVGVDLRFKSLITGGTILITTPTATEIELAIGPHATTHQNGGTDEINVAGLSGLLADQQTPLVHDILTKHNGFPGGAVNFLRADGTWNVPPGSSPLTTFGDLLSHDGAIQQRIAIGTAGQVLTVVASGMPGSEYPTWQAPDPTVKKISGTSGAAGTYITTLVLTAASGNITGTGLVTVMTITGVAAGTYKIQIMLIYQTTNAGTGIDVAVNHTGTTTAWIMEHRFSGTGQLAATAAAAENAASAVGNIYESQGNRTKNTVIGAGTVSVDTANTDMMSIIEGFMIVTVSGSIEVKLAAEAAALVCTARPGSNIVLTKLT